MTVTTLLTDPDRFFEHAREDTSFASPVLVVLAAALAGALATYPALRVTMQALPDEAGAAAGIVVVSGLLGSMAGPFILWPVVAGVFHLVSAVAFGGEGSFRTNLALVGWGFLPRAIGSLLAGIANWSLFQNVQPPSDPTQVQQFIQSLQQRPAFVAVTVVGIVFTLWQGLLWTFAQKHARDISLREAALTVIAPVTLLVASQVWSLL